MKLGVILGTALLVAPAAFANNNQNENPNTNQYQTQKQNPNQNPSQNPNQNPAMGSASERQSAPDVTLKRLLPSDAKLVGAVETTEIRAFPEQVGTSNQKASNLQKEDVVGVGALDRMWTTKMTYRDAVSHFDRSLKDENIQPIAKTTTVSSTAYNVRMPDRHIVNVVVRNTQPTTIESLSAAAAAGDVNMPSTKTKTDTNNR